MNSLSDYLPIKESDLPLEPNRELTEFDFANALQARLPPLRTCGPKWFAYRDGAYRESTRDIYRPAAQNILPPEMRTARREKALLDHLEGRCQIPQDQLAGALKFDGDGILINALNGIIRVAPEGEVTLFPHSPERNFTRSIACEYQPEATFELFETTLAQCLPDPADRELFQLCTGNFLYPDCRFEVALACFGEAGRGKSTIAEPVGATLGDGLVTRLGMSQICDPKSYSLPGLQFAAVNLGTELDSLAVDESGNFKTLVSGEPIEVRPIYGAPFTLRSSCKLWFLANGLPRFKNGTEAEMRRMRFIRFDYAPPQIDVTLKHRLLANKPGVLNFMIEGLRRLMTLREIPLGGDESREVHDRFRTSNDPIGTFVRECCELDVEGRAQKEHLHAAFVEFCGEKNLHAELPNHFLRRLYERFPQIRGAKARLGDERVPILTGIRIKPCE